MNDNPIIYRYKSIKADLAVWSVVTLICKLLIKDYTLDLEVKAVCWINKENERVKSLRSTPINGRDV